MPNRNTNFKAHFKPQEYLHRYYPSTKIHQDERKLFETFNNFLRDKHYKNVIDVGSGPTIHHALALLDHADKILLTDYLEANLDSVRDWQLGTRNKHDWTKYADFMLTRNFNKKIDLDFLNHEFFILRNILKTSHIDVTRHDPLEGTGFAGKKFDLVTSFFCADSITRSRSEFEAYFKNILTLGQSGADFFFCFLGETNRYTIMERSFPSCNIDRDFIQHCVTDNRCHNITIVRHSTPAMLGHGYKSIYSLSFTLN